MDHLALARAPQQAAVAKPKITLLFDFDQASVLGQNCADGVLDSIDTRRLSDEDALKLVSFFICPQLFAAVRNLRARFQIVEMMIYTAKTGLARQVLADRELNPTLRVNDDTIWFREDVLDLWQGEYIAAQVPDDAPYRRSLSKLGLTTWGLSVLLRLERAMPVWLTC